MVLNRRSNIPLEFLTSQNGKKFLNVRETRAMQSKISLKFPFPTHMKEKIKMKPSIKQSVIDQFEKAYAQNCDQNHTRLKNRNVSPDSQFDKLNAPPI
jgi:hypothetical protein